MNTNKLIQILGNKTNVRILAVLERRHLTMDQMMEVLDLPEQVIRDFCAPMIRCGALQVRSDDGELYYSIHSQSGPLCDIIRRIQHNVDPYMARDAKRLENLVAVLADVDEINASLRAFVERRRRELQNGVRRGLGPVDKGR